MTEFQPTKLTKLFSDKLRHIYKTKEPSKDAEEQQEPTNGSSADHKEIDILWIATNCNPNNQRSPDVRRQKIRARIKQLIAKKNG